MAFRIVFFSFLHLTLYIAVVRIELEMRIDVYFRLFY